MGQKPNLGSFALVAFDDAAGAFACGVRGVNGRRPVTQE
jgi:hypothetical protein